MLNQLGDLFLSAVPTVIMVFLFYFFMRWSFFLPIQRVLAERHKRAEGARQEAEASRAAAHEKARVYNDALRKVRGEIFATQETARRAVLEQRQVTVSAARLAAQAELKAAKIALAEELQATRQLLVQSSNDLAEEIADSILVGDSRHPGGRPS
jgi:F0F1-type ATP synthase membrane subunit b/b'